MDKRDYEFTGHTSGDAGGADIDGLGELYQWPAGSNFDSMGGLEAQSEADRAAQRAVNELRDGTNTENRMSELRADCPGQREAPDLVEYEIIDEIPGSQTCGEWQQRQWKDSDNTGGEGVPPPDMPEWIVPEPKPKKPY